MSPLAVLEGTWEELAVHAETLKGKKSRLIVLPEEQVLNVPSQQKLHNRAARLLAATDSLQREPGKPSEDSCKKAFTELVTEKYKKMGLKL